MSCHSICISISLLLVPCALHYVRPSPPPPRLCGVESFDEKSIILCSLAGSFCLPLNNSQKKASAAAWRRRCWRGKEKLRFDNFICIIFDSLVSLPRTTTTSICHPQEQSLMCSLCGIRLPAKGKRNETISASSRCPHINEWDCRFGVVSNGWKCRQNTGKQFMNDWNLHEVLFVADSTTAELQLVLHS